ncbi:hypothetical protein [Roseateles puraquae]|uniref:Uncharacterized protein n=1 Tax=Roseateles puraquae TaxID=431059 RepID=A0A254N717_9BURK|nr:hypothetical protein [Roseateles puraquae]MDG0853058.1 hypothetical protein [Roseateles puraquae]OWR02177.1 hypothetical protein CDO81_20780 [Roseateles puraquae]
MLFRKLFPSFFTGETGSALRVAGGPDALLVGAYLVAGPLTNYLGLYRLPLAVIAEDLSLTMDQVLEAMAHAEAVGFARYDHAARVVWVVKMAQYQVAALTKESDGRVKQVRKDFAALPKHCAFLDEFYAMYGERLMLDPAEHQATYAPTTTTARTAAHSMGRAVPRKHLQKAPRAPQAKPQAPTSSLAAVELHTLADAAATPPDGQAQAPELPSASVAQGPEKATRPAMHGVAEYTQALKMLMGLREVCRDQYPATGDDRASACAAWIRGEAGPYKAADLLHRAMVVDDLDLSEACVMVHGAHHFTAADEAA